MIAAVTPEVQMMTIDEVAKAVRYTTRHVMNLIEDGRIPQPIRIGKHPRWPRQQIVDWIQAGCPAVKTESDNTDGN